MLFHPGSATCSPGSPLAGGLTPQAAADLGLTPGTAVGASLIDAHAGGLGSTPTGDKRETKVVSRLKPLILTVPAHWGVSKKTKQTKKNPHPPRSKNPTLEKYLFLVVNVQDRFLPAAFGYYPNPCRSRKWEKPPLLRGVSAERAQRERKQERTLGQASFKPHWASLSLTELLTCSWICSLKSRIKWNQCFINQSIKFICVGHLSITEIHKTIRNRGGSSTRNCTQVRVAVLRHIFTEIKVKVAVQELTQGE